MLTKSHQAQNCNFRMQNIKERIVHVVISKDLNKDNEKEKKIHLKCILYFNMNNQIFLNCKVNDWRLRLSRDLVLFSLFYDNSTQLIVQLENWQCYMPWFSFQHKMKQCTGANWPIALGYMCNSSTLHVL